ncbi:MAG: hypothetical protein GOMPHAMPRED_007456 [Gomphillus americanus]|uniref:Uncharacterized protein n=1 Tax=Gomphillus americanus TaxID=1940652 RepID=A0A8H3ERT4_9LECA|nr:MAG: hypothetical protein GOMPHAMPRED_007456 [Gomphillus americanus]
MATEEPEITEGIKRRPSNRDQLLSKAIKDVSKSILNLFKKVFLDCTGSIAHHAKSKRQKIRDLASRRVSQAMPKRDPTPTAPTAPYIPAQDFNTAQQPSSTLLQEPTPKQTQEPDHEQTQPLMESKLDGLELHEIFSGNGVVVVPQLEPDIRRSSIPLERVNTTGEASETRRSSDDEEEIKSSKENAGSRSNHGSISYTVPGAWPKSKPGSVG